MVPLQGILLERQERPHDGEILDGSCRIVSKISFDSGMLHFRTDFETKTGMILIRPGDLVVSGINAYKGAVALYTGKESVCATIHYGSYQVQSDRADKRFLWWLLRSSRFQELLAEHVPGGIKTELKAKRLLPIPIPLPPLTEQKRLVEQIDALAARIEEAKRLRQEANEGFAAFISSLHNHLANGRTVRISEILELHEDRVPVEIGQEYPQIGVKGFGEGLFPRESLSAHQTTYKTFNRLYTGAVVLSQVKGWEGAIAVCPDDLAGRFASPEYRTFWSKPNLVLPEYLAAIVPTPWFWQQLSSLTRGVGARRERIRPELFLDMPLSMPSLKDQQAALLVFEQVHRARREQAMIPEKLNAMLPSILDRAFKGELP
jgi:type I restriction enzyme S subunit